MSLGRRLTDKDIGKRFRDRAGNEVILAKDSGGFRPRTTADGSCFNGFVIMGDGSCFGAGSKRAYKGYDLVECLDEGTWRLKTRTEFLAEGWTEDENAGGLNCPKDGFFISDEMLDMELPQSFMDGGSALGSHGGWWWDRKCFTQAPLPASPADEAEVAEEFVIPLHTERSCKCGAWATSMPQSHSTWCPDFQPMFKTDAVVAMEQSYHQAQVKEPDYMTEGDMLQIAEDRANA